MGLEHIVQSMVSNPSTFPLFLYNPILCYERCFCLRNTVPFAHIEKEDEQEEGTNLQIEDDFRSSSRKFCLVFVETKRCGSINTQRDILHTFCEILFNFIKR